MVRPIVIPQAIPTSPAQLLRRQMGIGKIRRQQRGGRLGVLGDLDHGGVYIRQKNQAHDTFGDTPYAQPGRSDLHYARLSGKAMFDIAAYWRDEIKAALPHADNLPQTNFRDMWLTAAKKFAGLAAGLAPFGVPPLAVQLVPDSTARDFWVALDPVVLGFDALRTTPSKWSIAFASVKEAAKEAPGLIVEGGRQVIKAAKEAGQGAVSLLKVGVVAGGVVIGLWGASKLFTKKRT